ncbi:MAG: sigma 54-interacting transcriptional regulator [Kofleriaceae bacterium]
METAVFERGDSYVVKRFAATVVHGPDRNAKAESQGDELSIGSEAGNDLQLSDPSVSRHHVVIKATKRGLEIRDLDSTNGTYVGDLELIRGYVGSTTRLAIGRTTISLEFLNDENSQPLAREDRFGELIGKSTAMRRMFPLLERCAATEATVLINGETGTGKEVVAEEIHKRSARRDGPFVIVDCGALPRDLMESELFGHRRGAFTGADLDRVGAFGSSNGGTLFLDEMGELPLELQPALLRFLETRRFRPIGGDRDVSVNVRIIAATNRDLRMDVNHGRFRADLFFRLNVLRVEIPALRDREDDVTLLAEHFWQQLRPGSKLPADVRRALASSTWPGNVRELRNAVERASIVGWERTLERPAAEAELGFAEAKDVAVSAWEKAFLERLLERAGGNLSRAARDAKMSRSHLRLLMQRHGLERDEFSE